MTPIVYRPAEAVVWFQIESKRSSVRAKAKSKLAAQAMGNQPVEGLKSVADAALTFGSSAWQDLKTKSENQTRYELHESGFEVFGLGRRVKIDYRDVTAIQDVGSDKYRLVHRQGRIIIKPPAHLVSGKLRVPVGWQRNGSEVPYNVLIDELAARSGVSVSHD
jgi:hypothetical protein